MEVHFWRDLFMAANNFSPDQTAPMYKFFQEWKLGTEQLVNHFPFVINFYTSRNGINIKVSFRFI